MYLQENLHFEFLFLQKIWQPLVHIFYICNDLNHSHTPYLLSIAIDENDHRIVFWY